ncbi:MAG TPA: hypothetical protein DE315_05480 [Candidatus Omnitrophica bacterium]|nr:hypothetical protein [Candidatus Omnitrophota bacterium]HCI44961.1 hypothetical protein [Candidatus Omnitrophota bacterium]
MLHVPESLALIFHHPFLAAQNVLGPLLLFLQALGGIDFFRLGHGKRFFDGRDEAKEQQAGRHGTNDKDNNAFKIFHVNHSIK